MRRIKQGQNGRTISENQDFSAEMKRAIGRTMVQYGTEKMDQEIKGRIKRTKKNSLISVHIVNDISKMLSLCNHSDDRYALLMYRKIN